MHTTITTKNFKLTPAIESFVNEKFKKITNKFNGVKIVRITLSVNKNEHKAEALLHIAGKSFTMESANEDLYTAIDKLVDKLTHQVSKQLDKAQKRDHDSIRYNQNKSKGDEVEMEKAPIVKRKQFNMKPMLEEEAILQMKMLNHSFFFFFNADTETMCLLYTRKDGDYGLIEGVR